VNLVVLDTDVASTILRGRQAERLQAKLAGKNWLISFVTLGELTQWTVARSWGPRKLAHLAEWRRDIVVLPADEAVATTWGQLRARADARGRPRPVNDAWIAACCLVNEVPLATFNTKDYADFAMHEGLVLVDMT
jgi:toxin FitB